MPTDNIDPISVEPNNNSVHPALLVSAVLHLMSHYTANADENRVCIKLASVIERHLKALANLPTLAPVLRATCQQLSGQWACIVDRALPKPERTSLFKRLIGSHRN